tara:strand:+ start:7041 stop:7964 length:924 start_codon:yes stop_codon:yes gene_type:complete
MTLATAISMVLSRAGLDTTNATYKDQARIYLNTAATGIVNLLGGKWWFLHKSATFNITETITVSGISGTFAAGNTVTGNSTGATGVIDTAYDATNYPTAILLNTRTGTFTTADTALTNGSGATAAFVSIAGTQTYALGSDVITPHSFVDVTNDRPLGATGMDFIDAADVDRDYNADGRLWTHEGLDSITGKILIRFHPISETAGDDIRYRYLGRITDWTSSDDSTDMARWFPEELQPALWMGAAELYLQEKGDEEAAASNRYEHDRIVKAAKETNRTIWGNRIWRRQSLPSSGGFNYIPAAGSLTAA